MNEIKLKNDKILDTFDIKFFKFHIKIYLPIHILSFLIFTSDIVVVYIAPSIANEQGVN